MSIRIALAGNPNCGKTTLFNELTGSNQYVGNWAGVTVEKKDGILKGHKDVIIQDLPGIYSLSPYTLEEKVARNYLVNEQPDVILNIIDGTNLERNLYLSTQLIESGLPVVMAVNMMDLVKKSGDKIDIKKMGEELGCEVVEISALQGKGCKEAAERAIEAAKSGRKHCLPSVFTGSVEHAIAHIEESIHDKVDKEFVRWYAIKVFERDHDATDALQLDPKTLAHLDTHIKDCEDEMDDDSESIIINQRYSYIGRIISSVLTKKHDCHAMTVSDKIDRVVTNRILALPIFFAIMTFVYYISVTTIGTWATDWTNDVFFGEYVNDAAAGLMEAIAAPDWLESLVVDGIIGGVGTVLGFVPQIVLIFFFLALLEDSGYMARVAFIMDRIFRKFGLSGKSFIPILVGSGCGVPAVMATRTIEDQRDRHDHHALHLHPVLREGCHHFHDHVHLLPRLGTHGSGYVLPGHCRHRSGGHCSEEDLCLCRRSGTFRHGTSGIPYSGYEGRHPSYVGQSERLHHQGRHHHFCSLRHHLVLLRIQCVHGNGRY